MSNPLYKQYGNVPQNEFIRRFQQFQRQFNGNPQQIIQQMLNSGRITQDQFNKATQTANQMMRFIK